MENKPVVAAFDLDGTITRFDTLKFFLLYAAGPFKFLLNALKLLPHTLSYFFGKVDRQTLKEHSIKTFFEGKEEQEIEKIAQSFALSWFPRLVRSSAYKRIRWHQQKGHRCILVSASINIYLRPWAKMMLFNDTITSQIEIVDGKITGKLVGKNCRGPEKVKKLLDLVGPRDSFFLYAYGDSDGDYELLETADKSYYREMPHE